MVLQASLRIAVAKAHAKNLMAAAARDKGTGDYGKHDAVLAANFTAEMAAMNRLPVTSAPTQNEIKEVAVLYATEWATATEPKPRPSKTYQARLKDGSMPLTVAEKLQAKVCISIT